MGDMKKAEPRQTAISLCFSHVNKAGAKPCIKVDHMCTGAQGGACHRQSYCDITLDFGA